MYAGQGGDVLENEDLDGKLLKDGKWILGPVKSNLDFGFVRKNDYKGCITTSRGFWCLNPYCSRKTPYCREFTMKNLPLQLVMWVFDRGKLKNIYGSTGGMDMVDN